MIPTLASLTLRGLLNRRRTLLLVLAAVLMVVVAALLGLASEGADDAGEVTARVLADFGLGVLLPLVAVIVGTAAIGSELEDGTVIYLLAKPIPRWLIAVVKLVMVWAVVTVLVGVAMLLAGVLGTGGDLRLGFAYAVAAAFGALEYAAIFVALSLVTSRALVVGLAYVVIWEGVIAAIFAGTRLFSVRQHALAIGEALGGEGAVPVDLALGVALAVGAAISGLAFVILVRRLERVELRGETG